jgi:hypothetical protein
MANALTRDTLVAFDRALTDQAPTARALLGAGQPADDIREQFLGVGVEPSEELTLWWSCFGGPPADFDRHPLEILPDLELLSAEVAVKAYGRHRDVALQLASAGGPQPDEIWSVNWIPLFGIVYGGTVAADCEPGATQPSPVRVIYPDETSLPEYARMMAPSFREMIAKATAWLLTEKPEYSPDEQRWIPDHRTTVGLSERFRA